jgi:uncharacterized FAD-dependent dehydrogenase
LSATSANVSFFDVIIVGGGPAGLFSAYYLSEHTDLSVLLLERGKRPLSRACPVADRQYCTQCRPCNILCGIGGAGLFSDGKLNFIHKLGKTDLTQFMSLSDARALIDETEVIFNRFGMDAPVYPTDMEQAKTVRKEAKRFGIDLLLIKQKHLGSDRLARLHRRHERPYQIQRRDHPHLRRGQGHHCRIRSGGGGPDQPP